MECLKSYFLLKNEKNVANLNVVLFVLQIILMRECLPTPFSLNYASGILIRYVQLCYPLCFNQLGKMEMIFKKILLFICLGLTSLSTLSVISRRCLVVTGSSMLTFIVLPHCGIKRSQTLLPDTTFSHIILTPERPVLALPRKSECQAGSN